MRIAAMKFRWPWIVLVGSICVNVFSASAYLTFHSRLADAPTIPARADGMTEKLGLDETQRESLIRYLETIVAGRRRTRAAMASANEEVWRELAAAQPDRARVKESFSRAVALYGEQSSAEIDQLLTLLEKFTPEQRAGFLAMLREDGREGQPWWKREGRPSEAARLTTESKP
jgi:Spy/CpxP family protein refolding chaperone